MIEKVQSEESAELLLPSKPGEEPKDSKSVYSEVYDLFGGVEVSKPLIIIMMKSMW